MQQEQQDHREPQALLVHKGFKVMSVLLVLLALLVQLDHKAHKALQEMLALQV